MKIILKPHVKGVLPAWVWVAVGLACLALIGLFVRSVPMRLIPPCGFHLVTGHPCPTCGVTRMGIRLMDGRFLAAFGVNPFLFLLTLALGAWATAGAITRCAGRDLFLEVGPGEEKVWWLALLAGFLLNWAYLWVAGI